MHDPFRENVEFVNMRHALNVICGLCDLITKTKRITVRNIRYNIRGLT